LNEYRRLFSWMNYYIVREPDEILLKE